MQHKQHKQHKQHQQHPHQQYQQRVTAAETAAAEQKAHVMAFQIRILDENQKLEQENSEYKSTIHDKTKKLDIARNNLKVQMNMLKKRMTEHSQQRSI